MNKLCLISLILCLFLGTPSCKKSQEEQTTTMEEKVEKKVKKTVRKKSQAPMTVESGDATVKIVDGSGNSIGIDLVNKVPIRIVRFVIKGVKMIEARTTSRTDGFYAKYNEESGKVTILSPSGKMIAPGTGLIVEIICDNRGAPNLSEIIMVK